MARKPKKQNDTDDTPALEWIAGGIGAVLFLAAIGITMANAFGSNEPPEIAASVEPAQPAGDRYRVEFEAVNSGDQTAAAVHFEAEIRDGETVLEAREVEIDFLPPHSSKRAGVFFERDPAGHEVVITPTGYQHP